jgi:hypothetical protein
VVECALGPLLNAGKIGIFVAGALTRAKPDDLLQGEPEAILAALSWLSQQPAVRVVNLSLGWHYLGGQTAEALREVFRRGYPVVPWFVAASGNDGQLTFPARYDDVIGVGALTAKGEIWRHSGRGFASPSKKTKPNYFALGVSRFGDTQETATSFASPVVAAIVVLAIQQGVDPLRVLQTISRPLYEGGREVARILGPAPKDGISTEPGGT